MSIQSEAERIKANVAATYAAAAELGAEMPDAQNSDNLAETVAGIPAGGTSEPVEEKDVNFWDYDGTLLHSYTLAEAQALTELPPLPERKGLTCQGWNWTLEQIKSFGLQVEVGAVYITDDGKTRIKIDVSTMLIANVTLNFGNAVVNIDWGDGSEIEISSGAEKQQYTHQYAATGVYTIALEVVSGTLRLGGNNAALPLIGGSANDSTRCITEVYSGSNIDPNIGWNGLLAERGLKVITIPEGVTTVDNNVLANTDALTALILPQSLTLLNPITGAHAIRVLSLPWGITTINRMINLSALKRITLPPNLTTIGSQGVCVSRVTVLHLPASLTSIGGSSFYNYMQLAEIYAHAAVPPTLGNASVFSNSADYLKIYVPTGSLEAYQTATNWAQYADRMEEWNP